MQRRGGSGQPVKVYGDLNFVTDLAQQFSLSVVDPFTLLSSLSGWPEQAGAGFSDHIVPAAIAFDCEARYVLSYGDLVTARGMCFSTPSKGRLIILDSGPV